MDRDHIQTLLNSVVEEVVDTVAAFDGRFAYALPTHDGQCSLSFESHRQRHELQVIARVADDDDADISLHHVREDGTLAPYLSVYHGPFDRFAIRNRLGAGLAQWYAEVVRLAH